MAINKKNLEKTLRKFKKVVCWNATMNVLKCVRLSGRDGKLTISGTSLQVAITTEIEANFNGEICVSLKDFLAVLKGVKASEINLSLDGDYESRKLIVSCDNGNFKLNTIDASEFPTVETLPCPSKQPDFSVNTDILHDTMKKALPFVSDDQTRPYISGMLFKKTSLPDKLTIAATNGHTMAIHKTACRIRDLARQFEKIIQYNALKVIIDETKKAPGNVDIYNEKSFTFFRIDGMEIVVRDIDSEFPPIESVIPRNNEISCTVNRESMLDMMKSIRAVTERNERPHAVIMIRNDKMRLVKDNAGDIVFKNDTPCQSNKNIVVGYDTDYMIDALNSFDVKNITMKIPTDVLGGSTIEHDDILVIIMPLRIQDIDDDSILDREYKGFFAEQAETDTTDITTSPLPDNPVVETAKTTETADTETAPAPASDSYPEHVDPVPMVPEVVSPGPVDLEPEPQGLTAQCKGTYYNGPNKAFGRCGKCGHINYEAYEGDACSNPDIESDNPDSKPQELKSSKPVTPAMPPEPPEPLEPSKPSPIYIPGVTWTVGQVIHDITVLSIDTTETGIEFDGVEGTMDHADLAEYVRENAA